MRTKRVDLEVLGTRVSILELLRRRDRTVSELAGALGLTANGARLHVARLERGGWIEACGSRPGVSKPSRLYGLAGRGRRAFSTASELVLVELLRELLLRHRAPTVETILASAGRGLARSITVRGRDRARIAAIISAFRRLGGDPVVRRQARLTRVVMHHCPLADVVAKHAEACQFGRAVAAELWAGPVGGRCQQGPRPSCRFDLLAAGAGGRGPQRQL